jgi:radical SAM superfamily enzyme YgiQ (UPF0313 family)
MRIALLYPPPWQIPSPGESPAGMPFGPARTPGGRAILDDGDFRGIPYGLLTIAAEARRAGHEVAVLNLAVTPWREVEAIIARTPAALFGISAFTSNRRGLGAVAQLIRRLHPDAHLTCGGPFVSALPEDTLGHYPWLDTAIVGEGEATFLDLAAALAEGRPAVGIAGLLWRDGAAIVPGPPRLTVRELDSLASPFDYFANVFVLTSRGCPSKCTFCGSATTWGAKVRFHSVDYTLDTLDKALGRLAVPFLSIKDDTFTAQRRRAATICEAIVERGRNFLWSCDTRVDSLNDELLRKMRLAGCQMISLGVESGSPEILATIRKKTTNAMVLDATRAAKRYGIHVRWYMIIGNRGETPETVGQTVDLIREGRPNQFIFNPLSYYPGTEEWDILGAAHGVGPDIFFDHDFSEPSIEIGRTGAMRQVMTHLYCAIGAIEGFDDTVAEREAVVETLPGLSAAHLELANAYLRAGRLDDSGRAIDRAQALGFPIPAMLDNQRACVALARGEAGEAAALLERAHAHHPHPLVTANKARLRGWLGAPSAVRGPPPALDDSVLAIEFADGVEAVR